VADRGEVVSETSRLRLRRLCPDDLDDVATMVADPEQMRFYPRPKTADEARAWLDWNLGLYAEHGFGTWRLESLHDGAFLGYCGLRPLALDGSDEVELAWHVRKTHWNEGLATEAALAATRLGLGTYGQSRLVAIIHPDNRASLRVAEKLGMRRERELTYEGEPIVLYATVPEGTTLRRGTAADAHAAADLWLRSRAAAAGALPPAAHSDDEVRAWFSSHVVQSTELWLAEDAAGTLSGLLVLDRGWVEQLYVDPAQQGRGIGSALLALAKRERPGGLRLWTFATNTGAQRFYRRHGFVELRRTDGSGNEERSPDVLFRWPALSPGD
jgi:RimJ/RimL family protein N-acetyltransferase